MLSLPYSDNRISKEDSHAPEIRTSIDCSTRAGWIRPAARGAYDASLCGWWPLDDGSGTVAVDASGKAVQGTLFGNPAWSKAGKNGGCLTFDGTDDYVFIDGKFKLPNYTLAVWFRDDSAGQRDIVSCYAATVLHGILLEVGIR